jgi:hypothetical protein
MNRVTNNETQAAQWLALQQLPVWKVTSNGDIVAQSKLSETGEETIIDSSVGFFTSICDLLGDGLYTLTARKKSNSEPLVYRFWKGEIPKDVPFVDAVNGIAQGVSIETPKEREYRERLEEIERRKLQARKKRLQEEKESSKFNQVVSGIADAIVHYDNTAVKPTGLGGFAQIIKGYVAPEPTRGRKAAASQTSKFKAEDVEPEEEITGTPEQIETYRVTEQTLEALQSALGPDYLPIMKKLGNLARTNPDALRSYSQFM